MKKILAAVFVLVCAGCVTAPQMANPELKLNYPGMERVESVPMGPIRGQLVFTDLRNPGEQSIIGAVLRQRAKERGANLSDGYALYLLQHQSLIPVQARGHQIMFPGTLYRDGSGILDIPYIGWVEGRWVAALGQLNAQWPGGTLVLRLKE